MSFNEEMSIKVQLHLGCCRRGDDPDAFHIVWIGIRIIRWLKITCENTQQWLQTVSNYSSKYQKEWLYFTFRTWVTQRQMTTTTDWAFFKQQLEPCHPTRWVGTRGEGQTKVIWHCFHGNGCIWPTEWTLTQRWGVRRYTILNLEYEFIVSVVNFIP